MKIISLWKKRRLAVTIFVVLVVCFSFFFWIYGADYLKLYAAETLSLWGAIMLLVIIIASKFFGEQKIKIEVNDENIIFLENGLEKVRLSKNKLVNVVLSVCYADHTVHGGRGLPMAYSSLEWEFVKISGDKIVQRLDIKQSENLNKSLALCNYPVVADFDSIIHKAKIELSQRKFAKKIFIFAMLFILLFGGVMIWLGVYLSNNPDLLK